MFIIVLFLSALFISSIAAWFSIAGLIAIFPSAAFAVGLMGVSLEVAKLVVASWLYQYWNTANRLLKIYFICAVCVLSFITSIGIFGYLTRAHIEGTQGINDIAENTSLLNTQIQQVQDDIILRRNELKQLDMSVNNLNNDIRTTERAIRIRNVQKKEREDIKLSIDKNINTLNTLQKQRSVLNTGQRKLETEVGPIKYVAEMIYSSSDTNNIERAVRLLVLLLIFVFDPLAILLVIAANIHLRELKNKPLIKNNIHPDDISEFNTDWNPGSWFKMVKEPHK